MKKVVLITGASAGMGKITAKVLAKAGYTVYGAARRMDKMQDLSPLGINLLEMDVTLESSMTNGISTMLTAEGRIDVLINNAGFGSYGSIEDVAISDARYQMEVNVFGAARLTQLVLPHMRKQRSGKIVNISSIGGTFATAMGGWYHASKFALEALSDSLRIEVAPFGIDVIVIQPGGVRSEWGGIAMENLLKVSGKGAYKGLAVKFAGLSGKVEDQAADPAVIANLIKKAIEAKHPKTRYSGGYMAKPLLFLNKVLPIRIFDKLLMSQVK